MNKKAQMRENILKHGLLLARYYGNGTDGPVSLCKALRRIENRLDRIFTQLCNGPEVTEKQLENAHKSATKRIHELLPNLDMTHFKINQDPRGYALKIRTEHTPQDMHKDWGGYGILAPDYS